MLHLPLKKVVGLLFCTSVLLQLLLFNAYNYKLGVPHLNFALSRTTKHFVQLRNNFDFGDPDSSIFSHESLNLANKRIIDTPGCFLPVTDMMPKHFSMKKKTYPHCAFEKRLVSIDDTREMLQFRGEKNRSISECTFREIIRNAKTKKDSHAYGEEEPLTEDFTIRRKELFATKCGKNINCDAHFPMFPYIQNKIDYWKNKEQKPISVLFMGFDTTSRLHFHRSLVKTLPLMTKMGFVDFKGFHAIAPGTLENFLAFLIGMTVPRVRATCAPSWSSSFDKCPLIWKYFHLNKFLTMYVEDGDGSFNWGGQGGFKKRPTDYYPHPLFVGCAQFRYQNKDNKTKEIAAGCPSTMNAQKFILDYNLRFLKKFVNTPFFTFTWFANPFHDSTYSLHGFDEEVFEFFQFLNSSKSKKMRENTLIIVNADHGERHGSFVHTGYEGFVERSLPGLFIRLPENLLKRYPDLNAAGNMEINSRRLVGGLDIYHTLLHLLKIQGLDTIYNAEYPGGGGGEFEPVLPDRTSLFVPVDGERTCDTIGVHKGNCVCNSASESVAIDNPVFTNQLVNYALKELNDLINSSRYKDVCDARSKPMLSFISANLVAKTSTFIDVILRFVTNPHSAQFEVQLRIHNERNVGSRIERTGPFNRLNRYGDRSWCVGFVTDEDKRMKAICHCKKNKPKVTIPTPTRARKPKTLRTTTCAPIQKNNSTVRKT